MEKINATGADAPTGGGVLWLLGFRASLLVLRGGRAEDSTAWAGGLRAACLPQEDEGSRPSVRSLSWEKKAALRQRDGPIARLVFQGSNAIDPGKMRRWIKT